MIALQPMPHEIPRRKAPAHKPPNHAVPPEERRRRLVIAKRARELFPSLAALSRALGLPSGTTTQWFTGKRPVPEKHLPALERIARTGQ